MARSSQPRPRRASRHADERSASSRFESVVRPFGLTEAERGHRLSGGGTMVRLKDVDNRVATVVGQSLEARIVTDVTGVVVDWSPAATGLLGYHADEVRGRRLVDLAAARGASA